MSFKLPTLEAHQELRLQVQRMSVQSKVTVTLSHFR